MDSNLLMSASSPSGSTLNSENMLVSISPNNSTYYIPVCNNDLKPYVGKLFETLEEGSSFYMNYADACGFDVRHGHKSLAGDGSNVVLWRYLMCNRQGFKKRSYGLGSLCISTKEGVVDVPIVKRQRVSNRCGCIAKLVLRYEASAGYRVKKFEERHTHVMVDDCDRHFRKTNRKLTSFHKDFIMNCMKANVGASKSYKMYKEFVGSYASIGATLVDFRNFRRDLNSFMVGCDVQIVLDNLFQNKERCEALCFDYCVDNEDKLSRLFWADPIARKRFSFFGDVVSADATYQTNRYNMVFVPFTGVDNNKKSITFGFGLLLNEDFESYVWLFDNFKRAMGHEPLVILTDQDHAVKKAIEHVFQHAVHRFCMWHIMFKLPSKVTNDVYENAEFRKHFNSIVWTNELNPTDFEEAWHNIISEFNLQGNTWLPQIFELRRFWIPAYFQDVEMAGLLRPTSRSESQNSFFSNFIGPTSSLVLFMTQFQNAIDSQRHTQQKLDMESYTCTPTYKTPLLLEIECAKVFTLNVFFDLQDEVWAAVYDCVLIGLFETESDCHYRIRDNFGKVFDVHRSIPNKIYTCSCKKLLNVGLPCSHLIFVLRTERVEVLPPQFIKPRWTKKSIIRPTFELDGSVYEACAAVDENKMLVNDILSVVHCCINGIEDNTAQLKDFSCSLKAQKATYESSGVTTSASTSSTNKRVFEKFAGIRPDVILVHPPPQENTKGRKRNRLKGGKEVAIEESMKESRICSFCKKPGHNIRTCKKDEQPIS